MASSNNSKSKIKKIINGEETSKTTVSKTKKDKEKKEENKKTKNKKLKLCNGNSKQQEETKGRKHKHDEEEEVEGGGEVKTHAFPMNRIRTMLKCEDSELRVSQEAVLAINKAAEKFLEQFTQEAYACSVQERRKYLSYNHLASVVSKQRKYDFLSEFVPEKVKAEDALRERNSRANGGG